MLSHLINPYFLLRANVFFNSLNRFETIQEQLIHKIIQKNKSKLYFQDLKINQLDFFKKNCPLVTYDEIEDWILDIKHQHINHLTSETIIAFSKSSGTTSPSKFIPLSKAAIQANFEAGKTMLSLYLHSFPQSKILEGKNFSLTGSYESMNGFIVGDVSALFTYYLSLIYKPFRVPDKQTATMSDWDKKLAKLVPILAKKDIRWIAGVPSWMSLVIDKIEDYTQKPIHMVWPHLEVYFYGGTHIEPFQDYFYRKFGQNIHLWQTYNASEGFIGLQLDKQSNHLTLLHNTGLYYEFIPFEEIDYLNPSILNTSQIEVGKCYELVITNRSGLYRYRIGDVIRIVQTFPILFEIDGRTKNYINCFGEELMLSNTEKAIATLKKEIEFSINDYTIAPIIQGNQGYHNWLIEFSKAPQDIVFFADRLDRILQEINTDYQAKRYGDYILKNLKIEFLAENSIQRWLEKNNRKNVQSKVPKLWKDSSIQDEIKSTVG